MAKRKTGRGKGLSRGEQLRAAAGGAKPAAKGRAKGAAKSGEGRSPKRPAPATKAPRAGRPDRAPQGEGPQLSETETETVDAETTEQGAVRQTAAQRVFRLGAVAGATPGKWMQRWRRQVSGVELELVPITVAAQREALDSGAVDAAIVRLPLGGDADALHVIGLYDEVPVVVASVDSSLLAADELTPDDLDGEVLITPADDVLGPLGLPTVEPGFPQLETTEDAIATAATGVGIVVVPMSLARAHHRRDVEFRPLVDGRDGTPLVTAPVAFAWLRDRDSDHIQAFVGITRGRTSRSSR